MKSANRSWMPSARAVTVWSVVSLSGVLGVASDALAQWKWRDSSGVVQYSDRPPPPGTPQSAILSEPSGHRGAPPAPAASAPAAQSAELKEASELDARKRKADDEEKAKLAAQKKAEEERQAKVRAENCSRAQSYQRSLNDGMRIARVGKNGEREILDDAARAAEQRRTQELINSNCR